MAYTREYLVASYLQKYKELGRPPTVEEINEDRRMPSYWTYYRKLGRKEEICQQLNISNIPATIYRLFCEDCIHDQAKCTENVFQCVQEAQLYFTAS